MVLVAACDFKYYSKEVIESWSHLLVSESATCWAYKILGLSRIWANSGDFWVEKWE